MIQTWNKFCFTGGYIEASVSLPGSPDAPGFWPGVWTMVSFPIHVKDVEVNARCRVTWDAPDMVLLQRECGLIPTILAI